MTKSDESRSSDIDSSSIFGSRGEREISAAQQESLSLPLSDEDIRTEEVVSSSTIKTEQEEEEVEYSAINNTLVWEDGTMTGEVACVDQQQQQQADANIGIIPYVTTCNSNSNSNSNSAITERKRKRNYDATSHGNINTFSETVYEDDDHNDADDNDHDEDHADKDEGEDKDNEGTLVSSSSEKKMRHTFNYYGNNNIFRVDTTTTTTSTNNNKAVRGIFEQEEENEEESNDTMNDNDDDNVDVSFMTENDMNGGKEQNYININDGGADPPSSSSVSATTKSKFDARWMELYQRLLEYKKEHDSAKVPLNYKKDPKLGQWVATQRKSNNNNKILPDRHSLLDSIDFDWGAGSKGPKGPNPDWMEMYQRLVAYKKEHNESTRVPRNYEKDPKLGEWVSTQKRNNNNNNLLYDRYSLLDLIDFHWGTGKRPLTKTKRIRVDWMKMYQQLIVYKKEHNDSTKVPRSYGIDPKLGEWVARQRKSNNNDKLLQDRRTLLDSIDFDWGNGPRTLHDISWMEMYQRLVVYKKQYSTTHVPFRYKEDPKLGTWVAHQRCAYKNKGRYLSEERCTLLDSIEFE